MANLGPHINLPVVKISAKNFSINIIFCVVALSVTILFTWLAARACQDEFYIRDHGVHTTALIKNKYFIGGRVLKDKFDIQYFTKGKYNKIDSPNHNVSSDTYDMYNSGDLVPIVYDPRNPKLVKINVRKQRSNSQIIVLTVFIGAVDNCVILGILWILWRFAMKKWSLDDIVVLIRK